MTPYRHETRLFGPPYWSSRQRVVILTFETSAEAEAWDLAGQPLRLGSEQCQVLFRTVEVEAPGTFTGRRTVILGNES